MKCEFCKKRKANTRHAKDYNHNSPIEGNFVKMCDYCHRAFHMLNNHNSLDWDYMIKNKKQEILELADRLAGVKK